MRLRPTGPLFGLTLRGMLVITTLLAIGVALVGTKVKQARDEKAIAAEILRGGGSVRYSNHGVNGSPSRDERTWFERLIDLDLGWHIDHVDLAKPGTRPETVVHLASLSHLRSLNLGDVDVSIEDLKPLARLPNLVSVNVMDSGSDSISNCTIAAIAELSQVRYLSIHKDGPAVVASQTQDWSDAALAPLSRMTELRSLSLVGNGITDAQLRNLLPLPQLTDLSLTTTNVTDDGLRRLPEVMPRLWQLQLSRSPIHGEGLADLGRCQQLSHLVVICPISDDSIAEIGKLQQLTTLHVDAPLTDRGLERIATIPNLVRLHVHGQNFTDAGARSLERLKSLTWLSVSATKGKFTDARPFTSLTGLTYLDVGRTGLPRGEAQSLQKALPNLTIVPEAIP
jgi:internalin A